MELVLPKYNVHLYFSLINLGKKCTLYMAKYSKCQGDPTMDRALKWEKEKALESLKERSVKEMQSELGCKRQMECV